MGIETFPEIENFQKLPHQVIVKGGKWTYSGRENSDAGRSGAELRGIVINNIGHTICDIRIHLVIFNPKKLPLLNLSTQSLPERLTQGGIAAFVFELKDHAEPILDYHLYTHWRFDDRE